ncbi:phage tail tip lysozyme [Methylosinus sp. PW1]|uniref:phage tail tip lysozyme n=1 Tax=Methylosinus sp. PW1 TaxID=107636 RepID=UPI00055E25AA|nr:phage tail tip lysozyme [Methylosinus sp. PW1]
MSAGIGIGSFFQGLGSGYGAVRQADLNDALLKARERELALASTTPAASSDATPAATSQTTPVTPASGSTNGASGNGTINITYGGALDKSTGGAPSPREMFDYLTSKGASKNEALLLTGAAGSESGFNPSASHDSGTGYGLFGHRLDRLDAMRKFAGNNAPTWQQQSDFALNELRNRPEKGMVDAASSPDQLAIAQMHFEQPQGYTKANPQAGHNFTGRLNTLRRFNDLVGGAQTATPKSLSSGSTTSKKSADATDIMNELFPEQRSIIS